MILNIDQYYSQWGFEKLKHYKTNLWEDPGAQNGYLLTPNVVVYQLVIKNNKNIYIYTYGAVSVCIDTYIYGSCDCFWLFSWSILYILMLNIIS